MLASLGAGGLGLLDRTEGDTVDLRFALRGDHRPADVVVVGTDDVTFVELRQRWPFPRALHAEAGYTRELGGRETIPVAVARIVRGARRAGRDPRRRRLAGEAIPLEGRICAIADVFDAGWSLEEALAEPAAQRGRQFDAALVGRFLAIAPGLDAGPGDAEDAVEHGPGVPAPAAG